MNKKNKVLLSTIGLVLLSGIAATGSTFAWFTSVRTASINFNDATVETKSGDLVIAYKDTGDDGDISPSQEGNVLTLTGSNKITDISGDGVNFYKPVWANSLSTVASVINEVTNSVGHYVEFGITVSRSNADVDDGDGLIVYIGEDTSITGKTNTDPAKQALNESVPPATRLAVIDESGVIFRWAPVKEEEVTPQYLTATEEGEGDAYGLKNHTLISEDEDIFVNGPFADDFTTIVPEASKYQVADLTTKTEADLIFRVWIEGTDSDTVNDIIGGVISVNISLYALAVPDLG